MRGFTLVELLVVLVISTAALAIVGPVSIDQIQASQGRAEVQELRSLIKQLSYRAYTTGKTHKLLLNGNRASASLDEWQFSKNFKRIEFSNTTLTFNNHGFVSPDHLSVTNKNTTLVVDLYEVLGFEQGQLVYIQ